MLKSSFHVESSSWPTSTMWLLCLYFPINFSLSSLFNLFSCYFHSLVSSSNSINIQFLLFFLKYFLCAVRQHRAARKEEKKKVKKQFEWEREKERHKNVAIKRNKKRQKWQKINFSNFYAHVIGNRVSSPWWQIADLVLHWEKGVRCNLNLGIWVIWSISSSLRVILRWWLRWFEWFFEVMSDLLVDYLAIN